MKSVLNKLKVYLNISCSIFFFFFFFFFFGFFFFFFVLLLFGPILKYRKNKSAKGSYELII